MPKFIYSTLSANNIYADWVSGGGDLPRIEKSVLIKGGSNVADKRLITPRGVVTEVSDDDFAWLKDNYPFKFHVDGGFLAVADTNEDPEMVMGAEGMEARDTSAPLEPGDFDGQPGAKPSDVKADAVAEAAPAQAAASAHPAATSVRSPRRA